MNNLTQNLFSISFYTLLLISCGKPATKSLESKNNGTMVADSLSSTNKYEPLPADYVCEYDNQVFTLGIGIVIAPPKFTMYHDSLLLKKYGSMDMYSGKNEKAICAKFH